MKTLSAIINEYKETKDESLKTVIWDFLMSKENNALFKDIFVYRDDSEWVEYENSTRIKRLCPKLFVATQVFETIGERYMCYCFRINLNDYSEQLLEMQRNNNIRLERLLPDEEFFTAAAVLAMIPPEDAVNVRIASGKLELDNWYITIDKMYSGIVGTTERK